MKRRIPKKSVAEWPRKQLVNWAYEALELTSLSGDPAEQAEADDLMRRLHDLDRETLIPWAIRGVENAENQNYENGF